ncbi:MAG: hypothetical protein ACJ75B_22035 [Flavisolibacter sp.]
MKRATDVARYFFTREMGIATYAKATAAEEELGKDIFYEIEPET